MPLSPLTFFLFYLVLGGWKGGMGWRRVVKKGTYGLERWLRG